MTSRTASTFASPIVESRKWLLESEQPAGRPLINVSQAAPVEPPPTAMRQEIARVALDVPEAHLYGPVFGLPALRSEVAQQWSQSYGGQIGQANVAITAGCNQAFCGTIAALLGEGDAVMLPVPWYFNHKMALDMAGAEALPLPLGPDMIPDPERAEALLTDRVKAIALVSPNNPTGVEYPADVLDAFYALCQSRGIRLILDETYRDFAQLGAHGLFQKDDWSGTLVQLYSFSKSYRLTGHRLGTIVADPALLVEIEKYLDTVTICPAQIGQHAALWGMQNLAQWLSGERAEILRRGEALHRLFDETPPAGWRLVSSGAYFGYLEHDFGLTSQDLAKRLVAEAGILMLPGSFFAPEADAAAQRQMRVAFANLNEDGIQQFGQRLSEWRP
ncbi:aminotransferase [Pseudooceanicola sp. C21-150M6]|uniref:aminotransferase n=1 Tax=Pseudooceanicola sp. C21-150M6 TaxID=3434355 RepID=UPI003D7F7CA1